MKNLTNVEVMECQYCGIDEGVFEGICEECEEMLESFSDRELAGAMAIKLEVSIMDIEEIDYNCFEIDGQEYLVLEDYEASNLAYEQIEGNLHSLDTGFLSKMTNVDELVFTALNNSDSNEDDINDAILSIIYNDEIDMDKIVDEVIREEGRGSYINGFDVESELEIDGKTYYYYKL